MAALRSYWDPPYRSHHQQLVQPRRSPGDLPEQRRSRGVRTYDQPQPPHQRGMPSRLEIPQQHTYKQPPHYSGVGRYEQLIDILDAATSRLESQFEEIDHRLRKLQASKAAYRQQPYAEMVSRPPRRRPTCWDPPFRTHGRRVEEIRAPPLPEPPPQYTPTPFHQPPLVQTRKPTCWDPPGARVSMDSLDYEESASIYYSDYDCDSDGYDEDFGVDYISQTIDEADCFMANEFDYPSDIEKGVVIERIPHTAPSSHLWQSYRPIMTPDRMLRQSSHCPPHVADPRHDPSINSLPTVGVVPSPPLQRSSSCLSMTSYCRSAALLPVVAAVPSSNLSPTAPSCSPDDDSREESGLLDELSPPAVISPPCSPYISGDEETFLDDDEEVDSIEEVKKVVVSLDAARVTSQDVVENCLGENGGATLRKFSKDSLGVVFDDKSGDLLDPTQWELEIEDEVRNGSAFARIQRPCTFTFDPEGDKSPKLLLSTLR